MTILRKAEHHALSSVPIQGRVLDLGGNTSSEYRVFLKNAAEVVTVDINPDARPDIIADLEKPLPVTDASFDTVLLMNVLEHIFEYRQLITECARVLRPGGGTICVVVPYLFPYHPSPDDYHRFSASALRKALSGAGFSDIDVVPLGTGVFAARWSLIERLLPRPLAFLSIVAVPFTKLADRIFAAAARAAGKKYLPADYALGFLATATKA